MDQPTRKQPHFAEDIQPGADEDDLACAMMEDENGYNASSVEHPLFYYDDGNLILSCEDDDTLFCVHRSILAKRCPVLSNLITNPGHEDRKSQITAGCIHLPLSDTKEDLETLLKIIYHDIRVDSLTLVSDDLALLSSIYRMAAKYKLEHTATDVYTLIRRKWPSDHTAHMQSRTSEKAHHHRPLPRIVSLPGQAALVHLAPGAPAPPTVFIHPAHIITLLRQGGCTDPEILAPLFYALSCAPPDERALSALRPTDFARYARGLERLRSVHARHAAVCPTAESLGLAGDHVHLCWPGLRLLWADLGGAALESGEVPVFAAAREPVELWGVVAVSLADPAGFAGQYCVCAECLRRVAVRMRQISVAMWTQVPWMFGLK